MTNEKFPFVAVPPEMEKILGKRDGTSRVYRAEGSEEECTTWFEALTECVGNCVSPGGVGMFCPVSRAAVHRRIKDGKLSMFLFHVKERKTSLFRRDRAERTSPYALIPTSECDAWKKEFEDRAVRQEQITREDLEGAKPDWNGEFMEWDSRWRREQLEAVGPRNTDFTIKLAQKEIKAYDAIAKELGMKDGKELAVMILGDAIHPDGMSGLNFLKLGAKIARLIGRSGTGVIDAKSFAIWK